MCVFNVVIELKWHPAEELCAWVRPPAQPDKLPQLQHYPGALAAGRPAECGVHTAAQQDVSHNAALQVNLQWLDIIIFLRFWIKGKCVTQNQTKSLCCGRMFERPTPSMHHLHRIHRWESNTTRFTLPPSYLSGKKCLLSVFSSVPPLPTWSFHRLNC